MLLAIDALNRNNPITTVWEQYNLFLEGECELFDPETGRNTRLTDLQTKTAAIVLSDRDLPRPMKDGNRVKAYYAYDVVSGAVVGYAYNRENRRTFPRLHAQHVRTLDPLV